MLMSVLLILENFRKELVKLCSIVSYTNSSQALSKVTNVSKFANLFFR